MKLCVSAGKLPLTGYVGTGFVRNVDAFVEDGECDEVFSPDMLNYIHFSQVEEFVKHLAKKVKRGGKLVLCGRDCIEICKMLLRGDFNVVEFNRIIYGDTNARPPENSLTIGSIVGILKPLKFKITKKRLTGYDFVVEAQRE